ncbi:proline--tRNA ligase [Candidatus Woesearchaeota archaeon]|nr:proline--tRNA ligase [Candidatus Woesearchaeota archaeon]MCF7901237.1 proline--tRNA ligase [Candidatus Woesearchaeota archaeon]MCF8013766.1 proline--tRNA ligase [Candidatus Woesearchaeota archaeon]
MAKEKNIGITVKKSENFSEWFTQIVGPEGAELADVRYGVQGFIVHMPWGFKILRKIYTYLEEEFEKDDHEPFLFPTVIKKENLEREADHAGFAPDVFWVTKAGTKEMDEPVALRPTGETQIYPMYSLWLRTYTQLPYKRYQSRITTFRNEKTTRPFLRGREFMFMESHNMYANHEDVMKQIETDKIIMEKVIGEKLKIPHIFFKRPKWDAFLGADATYVADTLMPDGRRNQMSSTHDLGTNFSKAYNIQFIDKDEQKKYAYQSCFGPGIWRIMAALIGIHGDDQGLVLPFDVSPYQIVIVPIIFKDEEKNKKVMKKCNELKEKLSKKYSVFLDKSNNTSGWKFNQWEMKGVPIRIEVGPKDVEQFQVALKRRTSLEKIFVPDEKLMKTIEEESLNLGKDIDERAKKYFSDNTKEANTLDELKSLLEKHKGFVKVPFCSVERDGEEAAEILKTETQGAYVCGTPMDVNLKEQAEGKKCIITGKPAKHIVYVAKSW